MLEKSPVPNVTGKELRPIKSLRINKDIGILQEVEGNYTVLLD
jgi:hypothetical protein